MESSKGFNKNQRENSLRLSENNLMNLESDYQYKIWIKEYVHKAIPKNKITASGGTKGQASYRY
jgi:hypothetical protein